jgi:hypothetical protein
MTLDANASSIREAGGVPSINHPNFRWALRTTDIAPLGNVALFEVHNAAPETNGGGRPGHPPIEALWDGLLSLGRRMIAIAVDDAHHYRTWGHRFANPGRAWVHVLADSAAEADVLPALEAGDCYASTGVELDGIGRNGRGMAIDIAPQADRHYRTTFVGHGGEILDIVNGTEPRYRYRGYEGYVRARVDDSDGHRAWLQAHFLA